MSNSKRWKYQVVAGVMLIVAACIIWLFVTPNEPGEVNAPPAGKLTDVILISVDTLRADHLSCYGYKAIETPEIDRLAAEGTLYERCFTPYPLTLPAHTSMLSGTSPIYHRVRDNTYNRVPESGLVLLQEFLGNNGYATGGFVSAETLSRATGIARGFDHYDDKLRSADSKVALRERSAANTLDAATKWMKEQETDKSVFAFIHLFDLHLPYTAPASFSRGLEPIRDYSGDTMIPHYDAEIRYVDSELGRFFKALREMGRYDNSLIILTSDHGEGLGDGGELTHGYFVYDGTTHVPLIIRQPKALHQSQRVTGVVQLTDIFATVAGQLGMKLTGPALRQQQGHDLGKTLDAGVTDPGHYAYIESHYGYVTAGWARLRAIRRSDSLSVVSADEPEYYRFPGDGSNLVGDPDTGGDADRSAFSADRLEIERLLAKWFAPEVRSRLRSGTHGYGYGYGGQYGYQSLPYYAGNSPYPAESLTGGPVQQENILEDVDEGRSSPHSRADELNRYQQALIHFGEGNYHRAKFLLDQLLQDNSDALQGHKLASLVCRELARSNGLDIKKSRRFLEQSAVHAGAASVAADRLKLPLASLELMAKELLDRLMLGQYQDVEKAAREVVGKAAEKSPELPLSLRSKYIRLLFLAQYQAAPDRDKRMFLAAMLEDALKKIGADLKPHQETLARMKRGELIALAPWERGR